MLYGVELGAFAELCLVAYCLLDVLRTPADQCRNLPKPVWVLLCFIPPVLGPLSWLLLGRPVRGQGAGLPYKGNRGIPPEYDRPGRAAAANPDDDAAFLAHLKARAEQQRKQAADHARRLREQEDEAPPAP